MLMVIFGAGASYDGVDLSVTRRSCAVPRDDYRPPLAANLLDDRPGLIGSALAEYQPAAVIASEVRASLGQRDIELVFDEYLHRCCEERVARQLMALRYYLRWLITECSREWPRQFHGVTNNGFLLDLIARTSPPEVLLVTLNYDTLIEQALHRVFAWTSTSFGSYVDGRYKLVKLHGSVDWGRVVNLPWDPATDPEQAIIERATAVLEAATDHFVLSTDSCDSSGQLIMPALAIPLHAPGSFECPAEQQLLLRVSLREVDRVLAIGWRGAEATLNLLLADQQHGLRPGVPFDIVSGGAADALETARNMHDGGVRGDFRLCPDGYSGFLRRAAATGHLPTHADLAAFDVPLL
ncbi:MAG: SIR2 family protein [Candidatus Limnocylindrales bacterium]